jgi:hypothetical protein
MNIKIESKVKYKKGDRVIANFGTKKEPEYYIGTITRSGAKVSITFDDGDKHSFSKSSIKLMGIGTKKKRKSEIPAKQLHKWLADGSPKKKPIKRKIQKVVIIKKDAFLKVKLGSNGEKLQFLREEWARLNKSAFKEKLTSCVIRFLKKMSTGKMRQHGHWEPGRRVLAFNIRVFNSTRGQLEKLILHEMCHQAVTDIDKVIDRTKGGHGPNWVAWMRKVGLDPDRYVSKEDHLNLLTEEERKEKISEEQKDKNLKEEAKPARSVYKGTCVKFAYQGNWKLGRFVLRKAGGKALIKTFDGQWTVGSQLYQCSPDEITKIRSLISEAELDGLKDFYKKELEKKRARKEMKKLYRM